MVRVIRRIKVAHIYPWFKISLCSSYLRNSWRRVWQEEFINILKLRLESVEGSSISRLELLVILPGVRAVKFVFTQQGLVTILTTLRSDSNCALCWMLDFKSIEIAARFTQDREEKIRKANILFRYVSIESSPAVVATRGVLSKDLEIHELWWKRPTCLNEPEEN